MKKLLTYVVFFLVSISALAQQRFAVNGYVKDAENGEELIGVTVYVQEINSGTITNHF